MKLSVILLFSLLVLCMSFSTSSGFVGITEELKDVMDKAGPAEKIRVNIIMEKHADYAGLIKQAQTMNMGRRERRERAIAEMERVAQETQAPLRGFLREESRAGKASDIRIMLGVNGINVRATKDVIEQAAGFDGVRSVDWDQDVPIESLYDTQVRESNPFFTMASDTSWGVKKINAPKVWDLGITGSGVLIGIIDTGINYNHADLADHMWDGSPDHPNHGYDFYSNDNDPMDQDGHGTACAGIVAGDGTSGTQTGVAPDATVMALRAGIDESSIWLASDFAITHGCHAISSSMSWKYPNNPDYASWRDQAVAELAAGLIRANSIGNQGADTLNGYPIPYNIATPGNCPPPWLHFDQSLVGGVTSTMGCGAVDSFDQILDYSGRGPAAWERTSFPPEYQDYPYDSGSMMGLLKPDICAPTDVVSLSYSNPSGYISGFNGTSAATPHLGGTLCLLLSADTMQTPEVICQRIQMNAVELGAPGKDNTYGAGRIDVYAAMNADQYSLVSLQSFFVNDSSGGDGDGRAELGETANLVLTLKASGAWADADSVQVAIGTLDSDLDITDSISYFGMIPKDSVAKNLSDPLTFTFTSGGPHWTTFHLKITSVPQNFATDDSISMLVGQPQIIIVDDDAGAAYEAWYRRALDSLGVMYDEWSIETQGSPPVSGPFSLNDHAVAIWFTGDDTSSAMLSEEDTTRIGAFLDGGGRFFISSQNLGSAMSATPFYQERLHAAFLTENANNNLCTGVPGDAIGDSLRLVLQGSDGAGNANSEDRISPRPGADSCFYYTTFGGASGIKYDSGIYKVAYFGFPFEAINKVSIYAGQDTVMARILKWFQDPTAIEQQTDGQGTAFCLSQARPNPFRGAAAISYSLRCAGEIDLSLFDSSGRVVRMLAHGTTGAGIHLTHWNGTDSSGRLVPSGTYFAVLQAGEDRATTKIVMVR
jgi:subtilisin family serine protease